MPIFKSSSDGFDAQMQAFHEQIRITNEQLRNTNDTLNRATITIEKIGVEHKALSDDQSLLSKQVKDNENDLRVLQNQISKSNGFVDTAKYFGLFILALILGGWNNLTTKIDLTTSKTESNAQTIEQARKENMDEQKQLDTLADKVAENRESILTKLDAKKDK